MQRPRAASSAEQRPRSASSASSRSASPRPRQRLAPQHWRAARRGLARAGRTQCWPTRGDARELKRACNVLAKRLGVDPDAVAPLPSAAAWAWPSARKGLEEREQRIRQALEEGRARDYAVVKAAAEAAKKRKQQDADDNGTQALVRELAATARREAPTAGLEEELKSAHGWFYGRTFKPFWELSGGDGPLLLSCAGRAAADDAAGPEDSGNYSRVGPKFAVKRDVVPKPKAPTEPDAPDDIGSFATYHKRGGALFGADQWDGKAAAGRLKELRKKRRRARRATQVRRMFAAARDAPAVSATGGAQSQLDERHRHLARELIDAARRGRREQARTALALDRGLEADDKEVRKALADYGDGGMRPPLAKGDLCTLRAWGDGKV